MSWKPAVIVDSSGKWAYNALRFASRDEAMASAADLHSRWMLVKFYDAHPSDDPVNYAWVDGGLVAVKPASPLERLRHHVNAAIARGEPVFVEMKADDKGDEA